MAYSNIDKPSKYFNTVTWTGTGSAMSITGVGFQPDWVWYKGRSFAYNHGLFDAVRGTSNFIKSNSTDAETSLSGVSAFNSDGFSLGTDAGGVGGSGDTFVAWNWLGANTTVSNTQGSITSTVSANTTSGFSIVSYTGTGANATVGHGLGVAPKFIIFKNRSSATGWACYNVNIGASKYLALNETIEAQTATGVSNSTDPTSSVFSIGTADRVNTNGNTYIAYCFAEIKGFSKFGSYTGNGSADGSFVYTGFTPAFIIVKNTTTAGNSWAMFDNKRLGYNVSNLALFPSDSSSETSGTSYIDILSNGFKMRSTNDFNNKSGDTYIYMCFASNPFVSSKGICTTAR